MEEKNILNIYNKLVTSGKGLEEYYGETSVVNILHKQLAKNNESEKGKHNSCKFYPSSAGMCSRRIVYQMMGYPQETPDGRVLMIFANGNGMHSRIEDMLGETGLLISPEFSFKKDEWRISGRSDAIINNFLEHTPSSTIIKLDEPIYELDHEGKERRDKSGHRIQTGVKTIYEGPDNDVMILELKSISDKGFGYLGTTGKDEHRRQLHLYMYLTGIRVGMLLYENKNTQEMKEFLVPYDPEFAQTVIDQIILVNKCIDEGTIPEKEYDNLSFQCRYCPYNSICWPIKNQYSLDDMFN